MATLALFTLLALAVPAAAPARAETASPPDLGGYGRTLSREMLEVETRHGRAELPLVIFVHGWGADKKTWTDPVGMWLADRNDAGERVEILGARYLCSPMREPDLDHPIVTSPLYKVFIGKPYADREVRGLWSALGSDGYNLLCWSQYYSNRTYRYAVAELDYIVREVVPAEFPAARDIVFVVHSRGGLVTRAWLAEHEAFANERVRAVMMISPANHGSDAATLVELLTGLLEKKPSELFCNNLLLRVGLIGGALKGSDLAEVVEAVAVFVRNALRFLSSEAVEELAPDSEIVAAVDAGDAPGRGPDVPYYLYQGISPHFNELFLRHNLLPGRYVRFGCALQDALMAARLDEMAPGSGDGLVTRASATVGDEVFAKGYEANHMSMLVHPDVQADLLRNLRELVAGKGTKPGKGKPRP